MPDLGPTIRTSFLLPGTPLSARSCPLCLKLPLFSELTPCLELPPLPGAAPLPGADSLPGAAPSAWSCPLCPELPPLPRDAPSAQSCPICLEVPPLPRAAPLPAVSLTLASPRPCQAASSHCHLPLTHPPCFPLSPVAVWSRRTFSISESTSPQTP